MNEYVLLISPQEAEEVFFARLLMAAMVVVESQTERQREVPKCQRYVACNNCPEAGPGHGI